MPNLVGKYTSRWDILLRVWILERHEGTRTHYVASYSDPALVEQVVKTLNEQRIDVV